MIRSSKKSRYRSLRWFLKGPSYFKVIFKVKVNINKLNIKGIVASGALSGVSFKLIISIIIDIKPFIGRLNRR